MHTEKGRKRNGTQILLSCNALRCVKRKKSALLSFDEIHLLRDWIRMEGTPPSVELIERAKLWYRKKDGFSWVHLAAQKNWLAGMTKLEQFGFDLNASDGAGLSALWHVQSSEMAQFLIDRQVSEDCPFLLKENHRKSRQLLEGGLLSTYGHPIGRAPNRETFEVFLAHPKTLFEFSISPRSIEECHFKRMPIDANFLAAMIHERLRPKWEDVGEKPSSSFFLETSLSEFFGLVFKTLGRHRPLNNAGLTLESCAAYLLEGESVLLMIDPDVMPGGLCGSSAPIRAGKVNPEKLLTLLSVLRQSGLSLNEPWEGANSYLNWFEGLHTHLPLVGPEGKTMWSLIEQEHLQNLLPSNPNTRKSTRI